MSEEKHQNSQESQPEEPSYFSRVAHNDATKKGVAGAVVGVLVGAVLEAWPR